MQRLATELTKETESGNITVVPNNFPWRKHSRTPHYRENAIMSSDCVLHQTRNYQKTSNIPPLYKCKNAVIPI